MRIAERMTTSLNAIPRVASSSEDARAHHAIAAPPAHQRGKHVAATRQRRGVWGGRSRPSGGRRSKWTKIGGNGSSTRGRTGKIKGAGKIIEPPPPHSAERC